MKVMPSFSVHLFEFHLHVLAHFQVEGGKGLVEEQHFGFVDDGTGYGNALLLSAGKGVYIAVFIVGHAHHAERLLHFLFDSGGGELLQLEAESNIIEYVEVGETGRTSGTPYSPGGGGVVSA